MALRTIDCSACGATVPYGRLSCPSCGELLASVAGAMRPLRSVAAVATPSALIAEPVAVPDVPTEGLDEPAAAAEPPAPLHEDAEPPDPQPQPALPSVLHEPDQAPAERWLDEDDEPAPDPADVRWPPAIEPAPVSWPAPSALPSAVPGAYLPPTPAPAPLAGPAVAAFDPPAIPAPARAWAGARAAEAGAVGAGAVAPSTVGDELRALTDPAKRDEMVAWLAVAGGTLASLGFLLPWSRTVIGSTGTGYFSSWGFAGPGHLLVVVGLLAIVALAVAGSRVPAWVRLGAPGLLLGGLVLGLAFPYLVGPLGAMPGVWLSVAGALVLVVAAIAALVGTRHEARSQGV